MQQNHQIAPTNKRPSLEITAVKNVCDSTFPASNITASPSPQSFQPPPEKRLKIVLNGESLKEFVMSKDLSEERSRQPLDPPQLTVVPIRIGTVDNNNLAGEYLFFGTSNLLQWCTIEMLY